MHFSFKIKNDEETLTKIRTSSRLDTNTKRERERGTGIFLFCCWVAKPKAQID